MIEPHDYKDKCWWCANKADSREHRFKKTDIIREFGKGPFKKGHLFKTEDNLNPENGLPIQGPNSTYLKFAKNICQKCNNERSQIFDHSYDKFMDYIKLNEDEIFISKEVNLNSVFGTNWNIYYHNLMKYFIKNICTRLADIGIKVEQKIIEYLDSSTPEIEFLELTFQIRTDWSEIYKHLKIIKEDFGYINASGIKGNQSKSLGSYYSLEGSLQYRWFQVKYTYDNRTFTPTNKVLIDPFLKLTEDYVTSPEEMKRVIKKNYR
jgi:hypothetical protein